MNLIPMTACASSLRTMKMMTRHLGVALRGSCSTTLYCYDCYGNPPFKPAPNGSNRNLVTA